MRHFLNDIQVAPRNLQDIGVVSNFTDNPDILAINVDTIILPREAYDIIKTHIENVGLFEGIPYRVEMNNVSVDYYVDLLDGVQVRQHDVEVKIKKRKSKDNFFERAEGSTFELLKKNGVVFQTYDVPYFVIPDNQFETALQLAVVTYLMSKELYQNALLVGEGVADLIEASTPIPGGPVPTISIFVAGIITASLKLIARIIYFGLLLIAVINLATQLFLVLFPPKRYLKGIYFRELLQKSCEHFGYTFASDLLDSQPWWAVLPVPLVKNRESIYNFLPEDAFPVYNNGIPSSSDTTPTILTFIQGLETMFNGKTFVRNGEVRFERRDWLESQTTNQLIPAMVLQSERDDQFTYNTEEAWKRYYIHYQLDFQDTNTLDGTTYDQHDTELSTEPTFAITNPDLVTIKGLNDVNIPFALATRKAKLTVIESLAKTLLSLIDDLTGIFGSGTNFAGQINSRKDAMRVSQTYFGVTKVLYGQLSAVKPNEIIQEQNYFDTVGASALWNQYHYINAIQNNDYIIKQNVRIRLSPQNFVSLLNNNFAEIDGVLCEILELEWIDEKSFAQVTYKQPLGWADGKVETVTIN